jgi:hypothetical protein
VYFEHEAATQRNEETELVWKDYYVWAFFSVNKMTIHNLIQNEGKYSQPFAFWQITEELKRIIGKNLNLK